MAATIFFNGLFSKVDQIVLNIDRTVTSTLHVVQKTIQTILRSIVFRVLILEKNN